MRRIGIRAFLRGGYREVDEPTEVLRGVETLFIVTPPGGASPAAHPEPEGVAHGADRVESAAIGPAAPDGQRGASGRRSVHEILDRAAKG